MDATEARSGKGHRDENFPVASWLVRPENRAPILAFYRFVRAADDVADHPGLTADEKLAMLDQQLRDLESERDRLELEWLSTAELLEG